VDAVLPVRLGISGEQMRTTIAEKHGLVVLFGSGEISASGRRVYDWLFRRMEERVDMAVLETPAGFQPNSAYVAGQIGEFIQDRLQNFDPQVTVVPARKRGTPFSPDDPQILAGLKQANVLFLGPGSPSYAVRQLQDSWAWNAVRARHQMGAQLILSSAATVAVGMLALPVYEIFKVGEDLFWLDGLDLLAPYGLSLVFIPHWNNTDGGETLDTSRCFVGRERFEQLKEMLPDRDLTVAGIDEHTALVLDLEKQECRVMGRGGVTLLRNGSREQRSGGDCFSISALGEFRPVESGQGIRPDVWEWVQHVGPRENQEDLDEPDSRVMQLVGEREFARQQRDWQAADSLRDRIMELGWQVNDTPDGPFLERL
jgi:cyanophycinase-like exopeptidase